MIINYTSNNVWCAVEVDTVTIEKIPETESQEETWMLKACRSASPDDVLMARLKTEEIEMRQLKQCICQHKTISLDPYVYYTTARSEPCWTTNTNLKAERVKAEACGDKKGKEDKK